MKNYTAWTILVAGLAAHSIGSQSLIHRWSPGDFPSVAVGGDVNNDGYPDVVIGVSGDDTRFENAGRVDVHSGRDLSVKLATFYGSRKDMRFGATVAVADLNRDGHADVIVGSGSVTPANNNGTVFAVSGWFVPAQVHLWEESGNSEQLFGASIAVADNLDGEGPDVVVGASAYCGSQDAVVLLDGRYGRRLATINGQGACQYFGGEVAAGDLDGDGVSEVIAGANEHSIPGPGFVQAYKYDNSTNSVSLQWSKHAADDRDHYGVGLAVLNDVDADGRDDVAVGASEHEQQSGRGFVEIVSGSGNGQFVTGRIGRAVGDYFGDSLASLGDVNGDGIPDLAVGAPQIGNSGSGYVGIFSVTSSGLTKLHELAGSVDTGFGRLVSSARVSNGGTVLAICGDSTVELHAFEPGRVENLGPGCAGTVGEPVLAGATGLPPTPGNDYEFRLTNLPENPAAWLIVGLSKDEWGSLALPFDLGILGMTGCHWRTSGELLQPMAPCTSAPGLCRSLRVPVLLGFEFYVQSLVQDPGANPFQLILSNALVVRT